MKFFGDRLTKGIAIVKIAEDTDIFRNTDVYVGGHPIPNETGYEACLKIFELVDSAGPDDLFIAVISGGSLRSDELPHWRGLLCRTRWTPPMFFSNQEREYMR